MGVERQQGTDYQLSLLKWGQEAVRHGDSGEGGTGTGACEEQQTTTLSERKRALTEALITEALMEEVAEPRNLNRAYQRVKANRGAPGVDGMRVEDLREWLGEHREELRASLLDGSYQPNWYGEWKSPSREEGCGNWASQRWWTAWYSKAPPDAGTAVGANLFGVKLWISARTQRAPGTAPGPGIRSGRAGDSGGPGPGEIL